MAEFGSCHRNEPSGSLHGIMRVRNFVQDDAHIFCAEDHILDECAEFTEQLHAGLPGLRLHRHQVQAVDPAREARRHRRAVGRRRAALDAESLTPLGLRIHELQPGEGAFYGPRSSSRSRTALGRVAVRHAAGRLQHCRCASVPSTSTEDNTEVPVMLHRAILGSLERFIGILIEHHAGALPMWLAPVQAVVMNITEAQSEYALAVAQSLKKQGFRVQTDLRNEKINYKIREFSLQKVPYILVVGDKERQAGTVAVRARGGLDLGAIPLEAFASRLSDDISTRRAMPSKDR
jgi:threonyl-tRNA synthetase